MKTKAILIIGILAVLAGSCIPSLFPLYTQDDIIFDKGIEGAWDGGDIGVCTIEKLEYHPNSSFMDPDWTELDEDSDPENIHYRLTVKKVFEKDTSEVGFLMHLFRLGDYMYANFYPDSYETEHGFLFWHMVQTNTFTQIEIFNERFELRAFDPVFLENLIKDSRIRISHVSMGGKILITAPTEDLQKFVLKYSDEDGALMEPNVFKKI